jgi:hypothetical protein
MTRQFSEIRRGLFKTKVKPKVIEPDVSKYKKRISYKEYIE